jgi:hypothetical protein
MKSIIRNGIHKIIGTSHLINDLRTLRSHILEEENLEKIALRISREQTADYIIKNLPKARAFQTVEDIIDFSVDSVAEHLKTGLFLEFGVWKGHSINRIASKTHNLVHGFDSFEGLPEAWRTGFETGEFALPENQLPKVGDNVQLIKGWFDQTLPDFVNKTDADIALLHVDCDLYSSTKTIFKHLGSRLVSGSIVLFDEYFGYPTWEQHEHLAFQEFISSSGKAYEYLGYNANHEQVVVRIK